MLNFGEAVKVIDNVNNSGIYRLDAVMFLSVVCTMIDSYYAINPDNEFGTPEELAETVNTFVKRVNDEEGRMTIF